MIKQLLARLRRNQGDVPQDGPSPDSEEGLLATWPKRPPSRRALISKTLIVIVATSPLTAGLVVGAILMLAPAGRVLMYAGTPQTDAPLPAATRSIQEEIAAGVRAAEEQVRAERDAAAAPGDVADLPGVAELVAGDAPTPEATAADSPAAADDGGALSPEEAAALAAAGGGEVTLTPDPLRVAPIPGLQEPGAFGPVPRISEDGRKPWQEYKRPFTAGEDDRLVAMVVTGLGMRAEITEQVIRTLPREVTLAFDPYGRDLRNWLDTARQYGHEVLLTVPMEPDNFPLSDPGPRALLTSIGEQENLVRLEWLLARFPGYVGITNGLGSRFAATDAAIRPVILVMQQRGLLYFDSDTSGRSLAAQLATNIGVPTAIANIRIDRIASRLEIDARLRDLERLAIREDLAIGVARALPVSIKRIARWAAGLKRRNLVLAPISAVVDKQLEPKIDAGALARDGAPEDAAEDETTTE